MVNQDQIEKYKAQILEISEQDFYHKDCPELQIDTLGLMVDELIKDNQDGKYNSLIALYTHIGISLKRLIKYQQLNSEHDGKY